MNWRTQLGALVQWIGLGALVGVFCGGASALFLFLLEEVTDYRGGHELIVYFLPLAGLVIGVLYARFGESIKAGNNLVIDTIHDEGPEIPLRMLPMVLVGTSQTRVLPDQWTVVSADGSLTAHWEHSVAITEGEALILTLP